MAAAATRVRRTVQIRPDVYAQLRREADALHVPLTRLVEERLLGRRTVVEEVARMGERLRAMEALLGVET